MAPTAAAVAAISSVVSAVFTAAAVGVMVMSVESVSLRLNLRSSYSSGVFCPPG